MLALCVALVSSSGPRPRPLAGPTSEDDAFEQGVSHHPVPAVGAACDLAAGEDALEGRRAVGVDHEAAVLVVEDRVGQQRLGEGVDARSRKRRSMYGSETSASATGIRVVSRSTAGRPSARGHAATGCDLVEDRLGDLVARAERVRELLAVRR